jgi:hypothetical protein
MVAVLCGVAAGLLAACTAGLTPIAINSPSISPSPSVGAATPSSSAAPTPSAKASTPSAHQSASPTPLAQTVKLDINQQFPPDNPGSYARVTPTFTVSDEWKIAYNFNCDSAQGFGFVVTVYQGEGATQTDMLAGDAYNDKGSNVVIEHVGGTFHLTVLTAAGCTWRVVVTG